MARIGQGPEAEQPRRDPRCRQRGIGDVDPRERGQVSHGPVEADDAAGEPAAGEPRAMASLR